jgi:hypothetical protein
MSVGGWRGAWPRAGGLRWNSSPTVLSDLYKIQDSFEVLKTHTYRSYIAGLSHTMIVAMGGRLISCAYVYCNGDSPYKPKRGA